jgi:hypothetical protein
MVIKRFLSILFLCLFTFSYADELVPMEKVNKPVVCGNADNIIKGLLKTNKKPMFVGKTKESQIVILLDQQNTSWVMIEYDEDTACIIGSGERFSFRLPELPEGIMAER